MKVKMLTLSSGPSGTRHVGQVIEVGDEEGQQLIEGRYAEPVDTTPADSKKPGSGEFDVKGFLGQAMKKVVAGVPKIDSLWLQAVRDSEAAERERPAVLEALDAEIAKRAEGEGAGA